MRLLKKTIILLTSMFIGSASIAAAESFTGKELYFQNCTLCHDENGIGAMPGVPDINGSTGPLWKSTDELFNSINNGIANTDLPIFMPPKGGNDDLTSSQIYELIKFMRQKFGKRIQGKKK